MEVFDVKMLMKMRSDPHRCDPPIPQVFKRQQIILRLPQSRLNPRVHVSEGAVAGVVEAFEDGGFDFYF